MDNISREMEILRKNKKETLEIKNTVIKIINVFDKLLSRLDMDDERIFELEDMTLETSKTEKQRVKMQKYKTLYANCGTTTKNVT